MLLPILCSYAHTEYRACAVCRCAEVDNGLRTVVRYNTFENTFHEGQGM